MSVSDSTFARIVEIARAMPRDRKHNHWSFLLRRSRIVAIGVNQEHVTHPKNLSLDYRGRDGADIRRLVGIHSELDAALVCGRICNYTKLSMVNVRLDHAGELMLSRPCRGCQDLIRQLGIRKTYYSTPEGFYAL